MSSRKIIYFLFEVNIRQRRLYMLQNILMTSSLNIWYIIFLCKVLVSQRSQRQAHSTTQWDRNFIDNLRKCLAYLFLYLKAVIECIYTRQLALLQIINLSWPALSFAVWHFPVLITSVKNKKFEWKALCKPPL